MEALALDLCDSSDPAHMLVGWSGIRMPRVYGRRDAGNDARLSTITSGKRIALEFAARPGTLPIFWVSRVLRVFSAGGPIVAYSVEG